MGLLRSLRFRLTLWYVFLLAIILAGFSAGVYLTLRHYLSQNLNDTLESRGEELLGAVRFQGSRPTLAGSLPDQNPNADDQFVRVFDRTAATTFDTSERSAVPVAPAALKAALAGETVTHRARGANGAFRLRTIPIRRQGEVVGALEVACSEEDLAATLRALLVILGVAYPVTLILASLGGVFLAGRALAPIDAITRLAQRISAHDLRQRLDLALPDDELGRLARTLNDMIARLEAAFQRQRQFTADASHELRTPLTAIKGQIEVARARPRAPAAYQEVLARVNEEVDRLVRLVGSLFTLARADAGEIPIAAEPVAIEEIARAAVEQVRPAAAARGVTLSLDGARNVTVRGDQDLLLQLLLNLLDNAVKYTATGGHVTAGWDEQDGSVVRLWVRDSGIGIASEHHARVFDRFYRVDAARSRAEGGAGLGLSICRWIAEAHGGSITLESALGRGATFTVRLPAR